MNQFASLAVRVNSYPHWVQTCVTGSSARLVSSCRFCISRYGRISSSSLSFSARGVDVLGLSRAFVLSSCLFCCAGEVLLDVDACDPTGDEGLDVSLPSRGVVTCCDSLLGVRTSVS